MSTAERLDRIEGKVDQLLSALFPPTPKKKTRRAMVEEMKAKILRDELKKRKS